jgi:hypothetical protein
MDLDESSRCRVLNLILEAVEHAEPQAVAEIRGLLGGSAHAPAAAVPPEIWNSGRLNGFLADIDAAIGASNYDRAVTLSYTCLEGFYGAFFRAKAPGQQPSHDILVLSRWIRDWIRASIADYPDEVLNLINHTSHAVDRARNRFSEAHFAGEAGRWLAVYVRDIVNTQIRLLLHFL